MAAVAVIGDVTATPSLVLSSKAAGGSGTWTAGTVSYSSYSGLKAGQPVIWKAECAFSFSGANSGGSAVTDDETVTLSATSKKLNKAQNSVLVDGDTLTGTKGNKLQVSASGRLKTS